MFDLFRENYFRIRGSRFLSRRNYRKARYYFEKVLLLSSSKQDLFTYSIILLSLGKYQEAEKYLDKIDKDYENNEIFGVTFGETKMMLRKWDQAKSIYRSLTEINPKHPGYQHYLTISGDVVAREKYVRTKELLSMADNLIFSRKHQEAFNKLLEAYELIPESSLILNNLGSLLLKMKKNYPEALQYFEKAYKLEPDNLEYKKNLVCVRSLVSKKTKNKPASQ